MLWERSQTGTTSISLITDCSRPLGISVNSHSVGLAKKFIYNTIHDLVDILGPGMWVIDIQAAYHAVLIAPEQCTYLGFSWELDGSTEYYAENRLCFGMTTGLYYFHSISSMVAEDLKNCFKIYVIHYLDDYLLVSPTLEGAILGQSATIKVLHIWGSI